MPFVNRIKRIRSKAGVPPDELADRLGLTPEQLLDIEAGRLKVPDRVKERASRLFQVSIAYLMGWADGDDE